MFGATETWGGSECMTTACACAVAYLVSGVVVLTFPPRVGSTLRGTVPWWILGGGLFLAYVGTSALLSVCWMGLKPCSPLHV